MMVRLHIDFHNLIQIKRIDRSGAGAADRVANEIGDVLVLHDRRVGSKDLALLRFVYIAFYAAETWRRAAPKRS